MSNGENGSDWESFKKWFCKWRKVIGYLIIIFGLIASYVLGKLSTDFLVGIGIVGLGTFLSMFTGAFLITNSWNLDDGEFRKALTVSIISVYFFSLAFSDGIFTHNMTVSNVTNGTVINGTLINSTTTHTEGTILEGLFNNLWVLVAAVITFYFTSRIIEEKSKKDTEKPEEKNKENGAEEPEEE